MINHFKASFPDLASRHGKMLIGLCLVKPYSPEKRNENIKNLVCVFGVKTAAILQSLETVH